MSLGRSTPADMSWELHTRMLRKLYHNAIVNRTYDDTIQDLRSEGQTQHSHNLSSQSDLGITPAKEGISTTTGSTPWKEGHPSVVESGREKRAVPLAPPSTDRAVDDEEDEDDGEHGEQAREVILEHSEDTSDDNQDRISSNWILCRPEDEEAADMAYKPAEDAYSYEGDDGIEISIIQTPRDGGKDDGHLNPVYESATNISATPQTDFKQPDTTEQTHHLSERRPNGVDNFKKRENIRPESNTPHDSLPNGNKKQGSAASSRSLKKKKQNKGGPSDENEWFDWAVDKFTNSANNHGYITRDTFCQCLELSHNSFFADRFFSLFDQDGSGTIELPELMEGLKTMTKGTPKQRLKFLFDVYDVDGSGMIDRDELKVVLRSCMEESAMQLSNEDLQLLTDALFDDADEDGSGAVTFEELVGQLEKYPGVMDNLTMSASNWLKPPVPKENTVKKPRYFSKKYIMNNLRKLVFMLVYYLINIGLAAVSVYRYWDFNVAVIIARACGMCLNFNGMFIVVLMLRRVLTWVRTTWMAAYLPLDQSIYFHKMVGIVIFVQSIVHTVAHLVNIGLAMDDLSDFNVTEAHLTNTSVPVQLGVEYWEWLFTLKSQLGWVGPGFAYLSGVVLVVVLTIMVVCSMPFVRRNGYFQVFYWTHLLYVVFLVFLILHGPIFWYFFIIPGIAFVVESFLKSKVFKLSKYGHMYITEVNLLPSKVTHIMIARPSNFCYKPGDYVFLNIPAIASQEWHPFTISSAPEREDSVWLHVRSAGHWTNMLYDFFESYEELPRPAAVGNGHVGSKQVIAISDVEKGDGSPSDDKSGKKKPTGRGKQKFVNVEVFLDGPYGTSTREIFETDHAVLIASGIGVTPYASILQSIARRYAAMRRKCPKCEHIFSIDGMQNLMKLQKVDFVWINRDQKCFEWFVSLLAQLEMDGSVDESFQNFLEMQMYMTAALGKNDMKGMGLQMAMEILHKRENRDVLTGLKTRTQPGRPDWNEVFGKIQKEKKGKVKVFFCGSAALAKSIKLACEQFGFQFSKENF